MKQERKQLILCLLLPLAVGALAAWLTRGSMANFEALRQPPLSPPGWLFPVVWTVLYGLMGYGSWLVLNSGAPEEEIRKALGLYGLQLAVNFVWPLLFFGLSRYFAAFLWILLLWGLIFATYLAFRRLSPRAGAVLLPYLLWVTFAAYLNFGVWYLNR